MIHQSQQHRLLPGPEESHCYHLSLGALYMVGPNVPKVTYATVLEETFGTVEPEWLHTVRKSSVVIPQKLGSTSCMNYMEYILGYPE